MRTHYELGDARFGLLFNYVSPTSSPASSSLKGTVLLSLDNFFSGVSQFFYVYTAQRFARQKLEVRKNEM